MESGNLRTIPLRRAAPAGRAPLMRVWPAGSGVRPVQKTKSGRPALKRGRPCMTAWCDQISTPAENQLRFTVPSTDAVLLRFSWCRRISYDADRSPLPERRGNNAPAQPMIASKLELSPCAVSVLGQLFVE